jgi:DNA (cytosine-5)-methyltransferase 1
MTRHGAAFAPPTSAPRIPGRACSSPLLPTPQARDHHGAQLPEIRRAAGHQVNLNDVAVGLAVRWDRHGWGPYAPAVRRWEAVAGRSAPFPGQLARSRGFRLSPQFAEWLMGLPAGWVTAVPGLPYAAQIRALGNGVVPAQGAAALRLLASITARAQVATAWRGPDARDDSHAA